MIVERPFTWNWLWDCIEAAEAADTFLSLAPYAVRQALGNYTAERSALDARLAASEKRYTALKAHLPAIYGAGYLAGHHDTVEGTYRDVLVRERCAEFADAAQELFRDFDERRGV